MAVEVLCELDAFTTQVAHSGTAQFVGYATACAALHLTSPFSPISSTGPVDCAR